MGKMQGVDWRQRFWYRVVPNDENGCWEWQPPLAPHGYGALVVKGLATRVHRLSYWMFYGDIPNGLWVLHKCDNRR